MAFLTSGRGAGGRVDAVRAGTSGPTAPTPGADEGGTRTMSERNTVVRSLNGEDYPPGR